MSSRVQNSLKSAMQYAKREALTQGRDGTQLALEQIVLPEQQPRRYFDEKAMETLIASVAKKGILQPLLVRPLSEDRFELVAGERRLRAAQSLKLITVPVFVAALTDAEAKEAALIENLQRENINPVEETEALLQLLALSLEMGVSEVVSLLYALDNQRKGNTHNVMGKQNEIAKSTTHNVMGRQEATIDDVFASTVNMSRSSFVANRLPLLSLPKDVLTALRRGDIAYTKALLVARVKADKARERLLEEVVTKVLSVEEVRERLKKIQAPKVVQSPPVLHRIRRLPQLVKRSRTLDDEAVERRVDALITELEGLLAGTGK